MVEEAAHYIVEADRAALLSICSMNNTEIQIYFKMVEVYDLARSHFLFDIVDLQVRRFLNAERLKAEALVATLAGYCVHSTLVPAIVPILFFPPSE